MISIASLDRGGTAAADHVADGIARSAAGAAERSMVSIVIPVFNEGENLRELVGRIDAAMTPTGRPFEQHLFGFMRATNGDIKVLREALDIVATARAVLPNGLADLAPRPAEGTSPDAALAKEGE